MTGDSELLLPAANLSFLAALCRCMGDGLCCNPSCDGLAGISTSDPNAAASSGSALGDCGTLGAGTAVACPGGCGASFCCKECLRQVTRVQGHQRRCSLFHDIHDEEPQPSHDDASDMYAVD